MRPARSSATGLARDLSRERKLATLLFADVAGYTSLNETRDPEFVSSLVSSTFQRLSVEVERYEGTIEKFAGDAMLAVFGVPTAHEDDPERAVRAAIEMQAMTQSFTSASPDRPALKLRIGVETGEVLVDRTRAAAERDLFVTGDAVNVAARLQAASAPGTVVVGPATYAATRDAIDYIELPAAQLKGKAAPVASWRAVAVKAGRGGRRARLGLEAPLVGRDTELALLKETVRHTVEDGRPHLVTVIGSAGVGKSRLSWELEKYLDGLPDRFHWRKGRCLAYSGPSFGPIADVVKADARIQDDDPPAGAGEKLATRLAELDLGERADTIAAALQAVIAIDESRELPREELFDSWRRFLGAIAAAHPLVLVLEDIHWADDGVLAFIDLLARWGEGPIAIICLSRHELLERQVNWGGGVPNTTTIVLEPLGKEESAALMAGMLDGGIPPALRERVIALADGNPLFAEEMVRMLVDRGTLRFADGSWQLARPVDEVEIPSSVQAVLAARLDTLPEHEKRVAQDASVVGRIFWDKLVAHISGDDPDRIGEHLRRLRVKDLVVVREPSSLAGAVEYGFRHALIRDVAYDTLPKRDRAVLHRDIARWVEHELADRIDEFGELIASHLTAAMRYESELGEDNGAELGELRAQTYRAALRAARRAVTMTQLGAAQRWYQAASELAPLIGVSPRELADLTIEYFDASFAVADPNSYLAMTERALDAMATINEPTDADELIVARLTAHLGQARFKLDDVDGSRRILRDAIDAIAGFGPNPERALLLQLLGWTYWRAGPIEDAVPLLEAAVAEAEASHDERIVRWAKHELGISVGMLGDSEAAVATMEESFQLAGTAGDTGLLMRCYINLPATRGSRGEDAAGLIDLTEEGIGHARRAAAGNAVAWLAGNLVGFCHEAGRFGDALAYANEAVEAARAYEPSNTRTMLVYRAFSYRLLGDIEAALKDEAAAAALDDDPDLQIADDAALIVAYSQWWDDPQAALDGLVEVMRDEHVPQGPKNHIAHHVARMAMRLRNEDILDEAASVSESTRWPAAAAFEARFDWTVALANDPSGSSIEDAARVLEAHGYRMRTVMALADAAVLVARSGRRSDAGVKASELASEMGMHPLIGPLPEARWIETAGGATLRRRAGGM
jgi:class 3 adenylate cyclase/tetratricopeptide (TPR) repeat protein